MIDYNPLLDGAFGRRWYPHYYRADPELAWARDARPGEQADCSAEACEDDQQPGGLRGLCARWLYARQRARRAARAWDLPIVVTEEACAAMKAGWPERMTIVSMARPHAPRRPSIAESELRQRLRRAWDALDQGTPLDFDWNPAQMVETRPSQSLVSCGAGLYGLLSAQRDIMHCVKEHERRLHALEGDTPRDLDQRRPLLSERRDPSIGERVLW